MAKKLEITPKIAAEITRSTDGSVDPNSVSVYEATALTTLPISKKGTIFDKATVTDNTLMQMAQYLNTGTNFVPMHTLHNQGGELPVGRVFSGQYVTDPQGSGDLRVLFYLPNTATDLLNGLEGGTIDEVSVGLKTQHINCSECGFDYLGPEATFDNVWGCTCPNDHTIGVDGVHTLLSGLDRFMELSLVSLGASKNAKIHGRAKALMGEANYNQQLAASGYHPEMTILFSQPTTTKKESPMDTTALVASLTDAKASVQVLTANLAAMTQERDSLKASEVTMTKEIAELTSKNAPIADAAVKLAAIELERDTAIGHFRDEAKRLGIAASLDITGIESADIVVLNAMIASAKTKLAHIPIHGNQVSTQTATAGAVTQASSFKIKH